MKIGVISDTRVSTGMEVPQQVVRAFEGVDMILHAGGIHGSDVLDWLEHIAPVKAVGRIDGGQAEQPQPFSLEGRGDPRIAQQHVLELEGHSIGMVNEIWLPRMSDEIMPGVIQAHHFADEVVPKLVEEYFGAPVDIVVFGRTLYALVEEHQGVLFVNPGSPSIPKHVQKLGNVAILELTKDTRDARLINLADLS
jgi:putative phosphoesterase